MCTDAASFNLTSVEIAGAVREIDRLIAGAHNQSDPDEADAEAAAGVGGGGGRGVEVWMRVRQMVLGIDEAVHAVGLSQPEGGGARRHVADGAALRSLLGKVRRGEG